MKQIDVMFKTSEAQKRADAEADERYRKWYAEKMGKELPTSLADNRDDSWYDVDPLPGITADEFKKWAKKHKDSIAEM